MIFLSAGHYPNQPGACYNGFCEHDEAVRWVDLIQSHMGMLDSLVIPTGTVNEKASWSNIRKPLALVEVHFNSVAGPDKTASGFLTMYQPDNPASLALATTLHIAMDAYNGYDRGRWVGYYRLDESKGLTFLLDKSTVPTVIIEPEFIHNVKEIVRVRELTCKRIAESLIKYSEEYNVQT